MTMRAIPLLFHDVYAADPSESGFRSGAADRYKLSIAAFEAQLDGVAAVRNDAALLATGLGRLSDDRPYPPFMVTVDDGGVSYYTTIADRLEARGWRGHCFVTTDFIGERGFLDAAQIRELDARGHVIGSHTASHPPRFSSCSPERMLAEWSQSRRILEDILGHAVTVGSVPGGYFSAAVARAARDAGLRTLFTSEPITRIEQRPDAMVIGRFTIRRGDAPDLSRRLVAAAPWARSAAWASWNAKGLVKPLLGPSYIRIADWLLATRAASRSGGVSQHS